ncbi:hypothetical protein WA158_005276 [Blastocystis sp. Blastoise]
MSEEIIVQFDKEYFIDDIELEIDSIECDWNINKQYLYSSLSVWSPIQAQNDDTNIKSSELFEKHQLNEDISQLYKRCDEIILKSNELKIEFDKLISKIYLIKQQCENQLKENSAIILDDYVTYEPSIRRLSSSVYKLEEEYQIITTMIRSINYYLPQDIAQLYMMLLKKE